MAKVWIVMASCKGEGETVDRVFLCHKAAEHRARHMNNIQDPVESLTVYYVVEREVLS